MLSSDIRKQKVIFLSGKLQKVKPLNIVKKLKLTGFRQKYQNFMNQGAASKTCYPIYIPISLRGR